MATSSLRVAPTRWLSSGVKGRACKRYRDRASATNAASPPEQLREAILRPGKGPVVCNNFRVSSRAGRDGASGMPTCRRKASTLSFSPAKAAVWDRAMRAPSALCPSLQAANGTRRARALAAATARAGASSRVSNTMPTALMRPSSNRASNRAATPRQARFPRVTTMARGRARLFMVRVRAILPLCDRMATPRSTRAPPC